MQTMQNIFKFHLTSHDTHEMVITFQFLLDNNNKFMNRVCNNQIVFQSAYSDFCVMNTNMHTAESLYYEGSFEIVSNV